MPYKGPKSRFSTKYRPPIIPSKKRGARDAWSLKKSRLWSIALGKPKSVRFFKLSFEGLRPHGKNFVERIFYNTYDFFAALTKYFRRKVKFTLWLQQALLSLSIKHAVLLKSQIVRKLIWSGGRLGRFIGTSAVLVVALLVFMFGEVLNSSRFVNSQEIAPDYIKNVTDIIPQRTSAVTLIPEDRKRSEAFAYNVEPGDTLSSIGSKFKISTDALRYVNALTTSSVLTVGQELTIPPISGLVHIVKSGDTLESIANRYDVAPQAVADFNYILDTSKLAIGTEFVIPGAKIPRPIITVTPVPGDSPTPAPIDPSASKGWCIWPSSARFITQEFHWYHNGMDIAATGATMPPLYSCSGGTVTRSGWDPFGLGLHVRIDHGNGYETVYGHMSRLDVGFGERVERGQVIGLMGSTGNSTGPHVHFVVNYNGVPQDPRRYIQ